MFVPFNRSLVRSPLFGLIAMLAGSLSLLLAAGPVTAAPHEIPSAVSPGGADAS